MPTRKLRHNRQTTFNTALNTGGEELNPFTMITCERFTSSRARQPFTVTMSKNVCLLMDIHCHLAATEVIGYLAGSWNSTTKHMHIEMAMPCQALEPGPGHKREQTVEMDPASEMKVREEIERRGMCAVGWYHSHPVFKPEPSVRDIENQQNFQHLFTDKATKDEPFLGVIIAPYDSAQPSRDVSEMRCFWITRSHKKENYLGTPMAAEVTEQDSQNVPEDLLGQIKELLDYYALYPQRFMMSKDWRKEITRSRKLRKSIETKLPVRLTAAQKDHLLDWIAENLDLADSLHKQAIKERDMASFAEEGGIQVEDAADGMDDAVQCC